VTVETADPVIQTLLEALRDRPPAPTLLWGRGLGPVARDMVEGGPVHTLLQDARDAVMSVGPTSFGMEAPPGPFRRVVVRLPRSKEALEWRLSSAAAALPPGGELVLAGHHREGIRSASKRLEAAIGPVTTARIKRRCRVLVACRRDETSPAPSLDQAARKVSFQAAGRALAAVTLPGVFSQGRVDEGTRRLLAWLESEPPAGRVLDLGAGAGFLGLACAAYPEVTGVALVDVIWSAVEGCRRALAAHQGVPLAPVTVQHADVLKADGGSFDLVVANPPFHDGREEDRRLIARFAKAAAARLKPRGRFLAVCNSHLPNREALEGHFTEVSTVWEDSRFRIWSGRGPRR